MAMAAMEEEAAELRRGPWTLEEDNLLMSYIACHGEGRWNLLARCSGLKRTGKSCRLRWLNYLKPDIKRGNLTAEEQLVILELHAKWGNRWSRIAQHLPGRTDNEIKNYWRTHMRKKAQEEKMMAKNKASSDSTAANSLTTTTTCSASTPTATSSTTDAPQTSMGDEAEEEASTSATEEKKAEVVQYCYAVDMDQLWNDIAASERYPDMMMSWGAAGHAAVAAPALEPSSPVWDLCEQDYYSLWRIDDQEYYNKIDQHALN